MKCPVCHLDLKTTWCKGQDVDICGKCGGAWFDRGEFVRVVNRLLEDEKIDPHSLRETRKRKALGSDQVLQLTRRCPRCDLDMEIYNYCYDSNIMLDKCAKCKGIWTDKGEMQSAAKHIKRNPDMDSYAKAIAGTCARHQRAGSRTGNLISLLIALLYVVIAFVAGDGELALRMGMYLIVPLACIHFGEELGGTTGVRFRPSFFAPVITRPTPGSWVVFMGWASLLFVGIFGIIGFIGSIK